ncbi:pseudouridine kinase isoform X1 [Juglans microcarpa x Juglans regia]|uniref:pseudouridine kinase isoform X1 n=1 Tax=Juglans microcarpa x Juglans regia TaxID=2249226 RepID=UPI001B7F52CB|nr:pseudouridine kinase isoform X1 [Juglans microcarpa x Juglans regia]
MASLGGAKMESSVQRRVEAISRHLLLRRPNPVLSPILLKGGQPINGEAEPVIIGGMVLDIHATPSMPANPRTTTPGKVRYVLGGVARNVAECMSKLGTKPYMISAVGLDMAGNLLIQHWKSAGLSTEGIRKQQDVVTPVVCNILDVSGELAAAVASVEAIEEFLTPEWIQQFKGNICTAPILMVDANLSPLALEASCQIAAESNIPVWFEPVSVSKSRRIASVANLQLIWRFMQVSIASPNEDELVAMANALSCANVFPPIERGNKYSAESLFQKLKPAIWLLLEKGIRMVVLTLGSDGVFLCSRGGPTVKRASLERIKAFDSSGRLYKVVTSSCPPHWHDATDLERDSHLFAVHFPALPASVVRLTGAGDCLVGGTLASICAGLNIMQSVAVGIAAAKAAVEAEANVPGAFSLATIADGARSVYSAAKVLFNQPML